jgi:hypothetical protein
MFVENRSFANAFESLLSYRELERFTRKTFTPLRRFWSNSFEKNHGTRDNRLTGRCVRARLLPRFVRVPMAVKTQKNKTIILIGRNQKPVNGRRALVNRCRDK